MSSQRMRTMLGEPSSGAAASAWAEAKRNVNAAAAARRTVRVRGIAVKRTSHTTACKTSSYDSLHHLARNPGESHIQSLELHGELLVVDPHEVQHRRVEVM